MRVKTRTKFLWLLYKNYKCYSILERIIYVFIALAMVHLVYIRCEMGNGNKATCAHPDFDLENSKALNLNPLYNEIRRLGGEQPEDTLVLGAYVSKQWKIENFMMEVQYLLNLKKILVVGNEIALNERLVKGKFLAGVFWDFYIEDEIRQVEKVALRFPAVLRTSPGNVWNIKYKEQNGHVLGPNYALEGFLAVQQMILYVLSEPSKHKHDNCPCFNLPPMPQPFNDYEEQELNKKLDFHDPIKKRRLNILTAFFAVVYIYPFGSMIMYMSKERDDQVKDVLDMYGCSIWLQYLSWTVSTFIVMLLIIIATIYILAGNICDNGPVIGCVNGIALGVFMLIWAISGICFCLMLYAIIHNVVAAILVLITISFVSYLLARLVTHPLAYVFQVILYTMFQPAIQLAIVLILFDESNVVLSGFSWSNFVEFKTKDGFLGIGSIILIMLFSSLIWLLVCWFFESKYPGKYGIPKGKVKKKKEIKLLKRFRKRKRKEVPKKICADTDVPLNSASIQIHNLNKLTNDRPIRNFSMNSYDDQITAILGLPNSGKTNIVNSITGSTPSTGAIRINSKDLRTHRRNARRTVGLAPQHDALFPFMSIKQHLIFYSRLRGMRCNPLNADVQRHLDTFNFQNIATKKVRCLTAEQRRKLTIANAFAGDRKVIIIDEPTERLGWVARREMWDILNREKRCRTILITTSQMEEADEIGDRIVVICDGELLYNSTATYMKNLYGSGYQLIVVQGEICQEAQITALVQNYIPHAKPCCDLGNEVTYNFDKTDCSTIAPMLRELEANADALNLENISIGTAPIMEMFLNATAVDEQCKQNCECNPNFTCPVFCCPEPDEPLLKQGALCINVWRAMFYKKMLFLRRTSLIFIPLLIFPMLASVFILHDYTHYGEPIGIYEELKGTRMKQVALPITCVAINNQSKIMYIYSGEEQINQIIYNNFRLLNRDKCMLADMSPSEFHNLKNSFDSSFLVAAEIKPGSLEDHYDLDTYYNTHYLHSAPLALLSGFNPVLKYLAYDYTTFDGEPLFRYVELTNQPYDSPMLEFRIAYEEVVCHEANLLYLTILFLSLLGGFFLGNIIREHKYNFKFLQYVSGATPLSYWGSHLLMDLFFLAVIALICTFILAFRHEGNLQEYGGYVLILILFAFNMLTAFYLLINFCIRSTVSGIVLAFGCFAFSALAFETFGTGRILLHIIPHYTAVVGLQTICIYSITKGFCEDATLDMSNIDCDHFLGNVVWKARTQIFILLIYGYLAFLLLILFESGKIRLLSLVPVQSKVTSGESNIIRAERKHIRSMTRNELKSHNLVLEDVSKRYLCNKKNIGADKIAFCVKPMDVVGLVGAKSGKTTILKLIVGQTQMNAGKIFIRGIDLRKSRFEAYKYVGYCPQSDAFHRHLTGRENLKIICLLRGIRYRSVKSVTEELAENLEFIDMLEKKTRNYSFGDKRRLSIAISVVGTPPLVVLDEPTAGIERSQRREILDVLKCMNESGISLVLASSNIEDYKMLCTRIGILDKGILRNISNMDVLRSRAGKGYIVKVKLRPFAMQRAKRRINRAHQMTLEENIEAINSVFKSEFNTVYVLDRNQGDLVYYIKNPGIPIADIFLAIETNRYNLLITDFSIMHENLELTLARNCKKIVC